jgi:hypothetical protein
MILKDKTLSELKLRVDDLSPGSHKSIYVQCDYCGGEYICQMKNRTNSFAKYPKDCCNNCRYKKREEVSLKNYGVKNSSQRPDIKDKIKNSNKNWLKSEEFAAKRSETMLKKYGTDNVMLSSEIKNKMLATMDEKYGVANIMHLPEVAKSASDKSINTRISKGLIKTVGGITLPQKAYELGLSRSFFGRIVKEKGLDYALAYKKQYSSLENNIYDFLASLGLSPKRDLFIGKKKPDLVVNNIAIECDGLYWHSDAFVASKKYHVDKMVVYKSFGYKPLFFRGDEICDKFEIVCSILRNALGLNNQKFYGRELTATEISSKSAFEFCERYHLMGGFKSASRSFALMSGDDILSVFQVKLLKNDGGSYDLSRYCTLPNTTIVGGFTKLLSFFERICRPSSIQTFIDMRYGSGDYLYSFGFVEHSCYPSFQWTDGKQTLHRMKFRGNSGYEHGFNRIWDCGQRKMVKVL